MMTYPEDLKNVARRVVWFEPPERTLELKSYFLTYVMTYGTEEDLAVTRKYYSDADFVASLNNPPPGIFYREAWLRWNLHYKRVPVPSLPKRRIPGVNPDSIPDLFPAKSYRANT
jgi:hypothetical protein